MLVQNEGASSFVITQGGIWNLVTLRISVCVSANYSSKCAVMDVRKDYVCFIIPYERLL